MWVWGVRWAHVGADGLPFHVDLPECHACYHRACFRAGLGCPRCRRFAERREKLARRNMEDQEDEGGGEEA